MNTVGRPNSSPFVYNNTNTTNTKPSYDIETEEQMNKEVIEY